MSLQRRRGSEGFGESDRLGAAFYPLYRWLFDEESDFVASIERKLQESRMADTVEMYLSRALGIGVISGMVLWLLGVLVGYTLFATGVLEGPITGIEVYNETLLLIIRTFRVPATVFAMGLVFGTVGFAIGFGTLLVIPYSRSSARKREINMLLADAVSFMYALSVGGLNQLELLEAMARADDTYGEVAREFQSIVQETEYFDTDYRTAIQQQAMQTPSAELSQFLTDMLSIVNSGGDMQHFLSEKKDKHMRTAKQQQELTLETLELFGEMYMTLSLFPLLLVIIIVIMSILADANRMMMYGTIYGLIPTLGAGFLVMVSTVKQDEPGDGYLAPDSSSDIVPDGGRSGLLDLGLVEQFSGEYRVFRSIRSREGTLATVRFLKRPDLFFKERPLLVLAFTLPASLVLLVGAIVAGLVPTSWAGVQERPVWSTFVYFYVPAYVNLVPLAVFREWNVYSRKGIVSDLSENLRKLSSANETGMTLLESIKMVADTSKGKLAEEFEVMYAKVNYGMNLREALVQFNNKYHIPRMARTVKLIGKAQEASSQITEVLTTAAQASENQDDIDRERRSRTRMQVIVIIVTYLTLLAVMAILKTQFLDVMANLTEPVAGTGTPQDTQQFGDVDASHLSLVFFHAVTIQAVLSGFISGYIRDADILSGVKFVVVLLTCSLVVWIFVG